MLLKDLYAYANREVSQVYYQIYDKRSGFATDEFNGGCVPCAINLNDSIVSLPSLDGLIWFNPGSIRPIIAGKVILFDKISCNEQNVNLHDTNGQLVFPDSVRVIQVDIVTPYFGDRKNLQIEYRLGPDAAWNNITGTSIRLAGLTSGKYELSIRRRVSFDTRDYSYKTLVFEIEKKWYEKTSWRILLLFTLAIFFLLFSQLREQYIQRNNKALEREVFARTTALNRTLDTLHITIADLETSERELQISNALKDKLTSILALDLSLPIRAASVMAEQLYKNIAAGKRGSDLPVVAKKLTREMQDIYLFIEEFLLWMSYKKGIYVPRYEKFSLSQLLSELSAYFENAVTANGNTLETVIRAGEELSTDKSVLKILLRNLIDNANKNTQNGLIRIQLEQTNGLMQFSVEDNGKGMAEEEIKKLIRSTEIASGTAIKGFGFRIIWDLVSMLHGEIRIASESGKGTQVEIRFPVQGVN